VDAGLKDKRLLIVEDNITNMAVYNALLRDSGAAIIQDFWNVNTLTMLRKVLPIHGILLDLMLRHGISGYDIFDQIKVQPELAHIPIIAVSAADPEIEMARAREKGFAGFIGKPIESVQFPKQIADCIAGKPVWYSLRTYLENIV
jgi:CheY-like chemotaxis protein